MRVLLILFIYFAYLYMIYFRKKRIINLYLPYKTTHNIPKIIYRTWRDREVPYMMEYYCHKKWLELNPDYSMIWFSDRDMEKYMESCGERIYSAFKKLKPGAFKSDLWRACFIYNNGGVYIDSFCTPYKSLALMTMGCFSSNEHQFISCKDVNHVDPKGKHISGIHNGFIMATKKHPYLLQYIEDMVENIENNYYGTHFLDITGPFCLMRAINKVNNNYIDKKPKIGWNSGKYPFYLFKFRLDINQNIFKNNICIMSKKYSLLSFFHEKIVKRGKVYSVMWNRRDVYN